MTIALLALAAVFYAFAKERSARRGIRPERARALAWGAGLAVAAAVLVGPFDDRADASLAWHMAQHLALAFVVAPLLVLGAPVRVALAALPSRTATTIARALTTRVAQAIAHPVLGWLGFVAILYLTHLTPFYEAALERPPVHALEHALYVGFALLFWTSILAVAPAPHAPSHAVRILMLFLAIPAGAFLGFILYVERTPLYAHYAAFPGAREDQANAGAVMWIAGSGPLLIALLWCVADWGARERRLGAIADRLEASP